MIIQVISRAASGLHVTLIELHAVLQTMYAAVTYIAVYCLILAYHLFGW